MYRFSKYKTSNQVAVTTPLKAQAGFHNVFSRWATVFTGVQNCLNWTSNIKKNFHLDGQTRWTKSAQLDKISTTSQLAQCLDLKEIPALMNSVFHSLLISVMCFFSLGLSFGKQKRPSKFTRWKRACGKIVSEKGFYNPGLSSWIIVLLNINGLI